MLRCLELAQNGAGLVAPNPLVGSVVVWQDKIIGEGYHTGFGNAHAEVEAIQSVVDKQLLAEATLYVNLEPCAHHGKTPPCADLIVHHKIPKVVIANRDPFAAVDGKGIERLRANGCEVTVGVLEAEGRWLNRRFFTFHEKQRPYVILKWAQTQNGYIDALRTESTDKPLKISGPQAQRLVHRWRSEEAAILAGTNTAMLDNPQLNVRLWDGPAPLRLVIDRLGKLPTSLHLMDGSQPTLIFSSKALAAAPNLEWVALDFDQPVLPQIMEELQSRNIQSVLVEGGTTVHNSFFEAALWDEARVFINQQTIPAGVAAPPLPSPVNKQQQVEDDTLFTFLAAQ